MYNQRLDDQYAAHIKLKIGLSAGVPVSKKEGIFEDTIQMAERLCDVVKGQIAVSSEVKDLYESENLNIAIDKKTITILTENDDFFLNLLMDFTEREWSNATLNGDHIGNPDRRIKIS